MALRASLGVVFGCQFGAASRLLAAAERGDEAVVQQVLRDRPQLAAFTGFHGTISALHRAAAGGHLGVCRAIVEPLKQRAALGEAAAAAGGRRGPPGKWARLLATVLNQRSHKSLTPLMVACERGHAGVAAYLLREGADPLAADFVHSRTCLHYAAVGGHADCLRLLCSDGAVVATQDGARPLRDVIVSDMQVQACRFIDQRAFGGLTALHFAVVTGCLEAVQALLRGGASIMVKSDGEAYIGDDFLVPGSSPLHVAVIISNVSVVHAILQAHMEMMNILGTALDERGRRPWEGTSRTDIRSVRNHFRKLPFHLARERHQPQLMSLVDPRIPIDVALDVARDTEHGIGPKRLGTICSLVLQRSLLRWLDDCARQLAREQAGRPPRPRGATPPRGELAAPGGGAVVQQQQQQQQYGEAEAEAAEEAPPAAESPFAAAARDSFAPPSPRPPPRPAGSASAPATPAGTPGRAPPPVAPATEGSVAGLGGAGDAADGAQRMASLQGYMGMLSIKRPPGAEAAAAAAAGSGAGAGPSGRPLARQPSTGGQLQLLRNSSGALSAAARVHFIADPAGGPPPDASSPGSGSLPPSPRLPPAASPREPGGPDRTISVVPRGHRRSSSQGGGPGGGPRLALGVGVGTMGMGSMAGMGAAMGSVFGGRRRSTEPGAAAGAPPAEPAGGAAAGGAHGAAEAVGGGGALLAGEKEKDLGLDSEGEPESPLSGEEDDGEDVECGVCLDALVEVAFAACQHKLCLACARNLTQQHKKPPHCPFCRRLVVGFQRVSATGTIGASSAKSLGGRSPAAAAPLAGGAPPPLPLAA